MTEIINGVTYPAVISNVSPSAASPGYLTKTVDLANATWNTQAKHEVFTVLGMVRVRLWVECTENVAGVGASMQFGHAAVTNAFIATTASTDLDAGYLWYDATPATKIETFALTIFDYVSLATDIGYEITGGAMTDGTLVFHCVWEAMNATGSVAVGAGGVL